MRSRGEGGTATITADTMAERFGVVQGTYTSVPLPKIRTYTVSPCQMHAAVSPGSAPTVIIPLASRGTAAPLGDHNLCAARVIQHWTCNLQQCVITRAIHLQSLLDWISPQACCERAGPANEVIQLTPYALPPALEWGEILVSMRAAPVNPADLYIARTGGVFGRTEASLPFCAGQDGVGVVAKVSS